MPCRCPGHSINIIVVDDNSPDGTAKIVTEIAAQNPRVLLKVRTNERGRGSAGIAGFKEAMEKARLHHPEMDADFSHDPKYIPAMLAAGGCWRGSRYRQTLRHRWRGRSHRRPPRSLGAGRLLCSHHPRVESKRSHWRFPTLSPQVLETIDLDHLLSLGPSIVLETLLKRP